MSEPHVVLLQDPRGVEAGVLGRFFSGSLKIPLIDAQHRARRAWGVLGENLSEEDARRLAAEATAVGIPAAAFPSGTLKPLPPPVMVQRAELPEVGLLLKVGVPATARTVPFDSLRVAAALAVREETQTTVTVKEGPSTGERVAKIGLMMATGIPMGVGGKSKEVKKIVTSGEFTLFADIFTVAGERYCVDPARFGFSGPRGATWTGLENLRRFLQALLPKTPKALVNRGVRWLVESRPLSSLGYDTRADYEKECRWLLALASQTK